MAPFCLNHRHRKDFLYMKRKIITLFMLTAMSLSLFGCNSIKDKPEDVTKKEETIKEETVEDTTTSNSADIFSAVPIIWSISQDGPVTSLVINPKGLIYNGDGQVWPMDEPGYAFQPDGPGVYERTWTCSEGKTVTQQVTLIK